MPSLNQAAVVAGDGKTAEEETRRYLVRLGHDVAQVLKAQVLAAQVLERQSQ